MPDSPARRRFVRQLTMTAATALVAPAALAAPVPRRLRFHHTHTGERLDVVYHEAGRYLMDALGEVNRFLRDFRTGEITAMDRSLLDILFAVQQYTGSRGRFEVISGYRSPATNAMLQRQGRGVATHSLHMEGQAIDVRLTDLDTGKLREAGLALGRGGVGFYPDSDFVHLDTGRVRRW